MRHFVNDVLNGNSYELSAFLRSSEIKRETSLDIYSSYYTSQSYETAGKLISDCCWEMMSCDKVQQPNYIQKHEVFQRSAQTHNYAVSELLGVFFNTGLG